MYDFGGEAFELAIRVKPRGLGLGQGPEDAQKGKEEDKNAQRLMQGKEEGLVRQFFRGLIRQAVGDDPQRDQGHDKKRSQPVESFGKTAIATGCVREGHLGSPEAIFDDLTRACLDLFA